MIGKPTKETYTAFKFILDKTLTTPQKGCHVCVDVLAINAGPGWKWSKLGSEGLVTSYIRIHGCNNIRNVKTEFRYMNTDNSEEIGKVIANSFTKVKLLKLDFANGLCDYDQVLIAFISGLSKGGLNKLEQLSLNFSYWRQITDMGMHSFAGKFVKMNSKLQSLELIFFRCIKISNIGAKRLVGLISKGFPCLKKLNLNFGGCSITDVGLLSMTRDIATYKPKLEGYSLNLNECDKISGACINSSVDLINGSLTCIKHLALDFKTNERINKDAAMKNIRGLCGGSHDFEKITIDFDCSIYLRKHGTKVLINNKIASLDFKVHNQVTNEDSSQLINLLSSHKNLKALTLSFNQCNLLTKVGLETIKQNLYEKFQGLEEINLTFYGCSGIEMLYIEEFSKELKKKLTSVPNIHIGYIWNSTNFSSDNKSSREKPSRGKAAKCNIW